MNCLQTPDIERWINGGSVMSHTNCHASTGMPHYACLTINIRVDLVFNYAKRLCVNTVVTVCQQQIVVPLSVASRTLLCLFLTSGAFTMVVGIIGRC